MVKGRVGDACDDYLHCVTGQVNPYLIERSNMDRGLLWVIIFVLIIAVVGVWCTIVELGNRVIEIEFDSQILEAFLEVHEGNGIIEAAAYEGEGPHPIVLLNSSGKKHWWTDRIPMDWRPINVSDVELVVIVGEIESIVLETCHYYTGPDVERIAFYRHVELIEAKTGEMVAETTLYGPGPRPCMKFELESTTAIYGSGVSFGQLKEWLESYVTADACMPTHMHEVLADEESLWISPLWYSESESLIDIALLPGPSETYDYWYGYKPGTWEEAKDFVINGTAIELTFPQLWFNLYAFDSVNFDLWKARESYTAYYEAQRKTSVSFSFSIASEDEVPDTFYFVIEEYSEGETPEVHVNATISWVQKNSKYDYTYGYYSSGLSAHLGEKTKDFMLEGTATEAENKKFNFYIMNSTNYDSWFDGEAYSAYYEAKDVSAITFSVPLTEDEATSSIYFVVENPNSNIDAIVNLSATIIWTACINQ